MNIPVPIVVLNGQRLDILIDGKLRRVATNEVFGITMMAVRGEPLPLGTKFRMGAQEWFVLEKRISTIKRAHTYVIGREHPMD